MVKSPNVIASVAVAPSGNVKSVSTPAAGVGHTTPVPVAAPPVFVPPPAPADGPPPNVAPPVLAPALLPPPLLEPPVGESTSSPPLQPAMKTPIPRSAEAEI